MRVVVAGAGGYIGGRLAVRLSADGHEVVPLVGALRPWLPETQRAIDLREPSADLGAALAGADAVVHLAGPSEVLAASQPESVLADTVRITHVLGHAAREAGVERFVYLSTVHVYGARLEAGATLDEDARCEPRHPYAIARLASEHVLAGLGLAPTVLRLTNTVGAPLDARVQRWSLVVNDLCRQAAVHGRLELHTDGTQWRDFVALRDAVDIIVRFCVDTPVPGIFNVGSGRPITVRAMAELVQASFAGLGAERPELRVPAAQGGSTEAPIVDVSRLSALGMECRTPLRDAVDEIAQFCLDHRSTLRGLGS